MTSTSSTSPVPAVPASEKDGIHDDDDKHDNSKFDGIQLDDRKRVDAMRKDSSVKAERVVTLS